MHWNCCGVIHQALPIKKTRTKMAAFQVMHVSPAKHIVWLPKEARLPKSMTIGQTDDQQTDKEKSDPYLLLFFASDTKIGPKLHSPNL